MADTMLLESVVGPYTPQGDGVNQSRPRSGKTGEWSVGQAHGRHFEAVSRGKCYTACNQAAITFGTALTGTAVTFTLSNPAGSATMLVLLHCGLTVITSSTAGSVVYAASTAYSAAASNLTVRNARLDLGGSGVGLASASCTIATPVAVRTLAFGPVTATASTGQIIDHVDGGMILGPNSSITIQGITIVGTGLVSMLWEEVPITA